MSERPIAVDDAHESAAEANSQQKPGGWGRALTAIVASPSSGLEIIRRRSPWLAVTTLLVASTIAHTAVLAPLGMQAMLAQARGDLLPEQADAISAQAAQLVTWLVMIGTSFVVFSIRLLIQTLFVWALALSLRSRSPFKHALSLTAHITVIKHLHLWAGLLLAYWRGPEAIGGLQDLEPSIGLSLFLTSENAALNVVYATINPFTIWFLVLLGLGSATVLGLSRREGWLLAGIYYGASTALPVAVTLVSGSLLPG